MCFKIQILLFITFTLFALAKVSNASDTTCEESEKHFANLCFSPSPTMEVDVKWVTEAQPRDGWHMEMGNDVARLHFAELVKGKLLTFQDNFDDICFRGIIEHGTDATHPIDGKFIGFGNLTSKWVCNASQDFPGVLRCDMSSTGLSKYHEDVNIYTSYSDNKNLQIAIACFPNGQVGWTAFAVSQTLTEAEKKTIKEHITSLGFSDDNTVVTYTENCSNDS